MHKKPKSHGFNTLSKFFFVLYPLSPATAFADVCAFQSSSAFLLLEPDEENLSGDIMKNIN